MADPEAEADADELRTDSAFDDAFGALTGTYPPGYLDRLDAEDEQRYCS